jgi:hypothetical protein
MINFAIARKHKSVHILYSEQWKRTKTPSPVPVCQMGSSYIMRTQEEAVARLIFRHRNERLQLNSSMPKSSNFFVITKN